MFEVIKIDFTKGLFARPTSIDHLKTFKIFSFFNSVNTIATKRKFSNGETWRGLTGPIFGHDTRTKMLSTIRNSGKRMIIECQWANTKWPRYAAASFVIGKILDNSISPIVLTFNHDKARATPRSWIVYCRGCCAEFKIANRTRACRAHVNKRYPFINVSPFLKRRVLSDREDRREFPRVWREKRILEEKKKKVSKNWNIGGWREMGRNLCIYRVEATPTGGAVSRCV